MGRCVADADPLPMPFAAGFTNEYTLEQKEAGFQASYFIAAPKSAFARPRSRAKHDPFAAGRAPRELGLDGLIDPWCYPSAPDLIRYGAPERVLGHWGRAVHDACSSSERVTMRWPGAEVDVAAIVIPVVLLPRWRPAVSRSCIRSCGVRSTIPPVTGYATVDIEAIAILCAKASAHRLNHRLIVVGNGDLVDVAGARFPAFVAIVRSMCSLVGSNGEPPGGRGNTGCLRVWGKAEKAGNVPSQCDAGCPSASRAGRCPCHDRIGGYSPAIAGACSTDIYPQGSDRDCGRDEQVCCFGAPESRRREHNRCCFVR